MVSKTRERLIEVARQLFAYKGVENTTMNDIAAASEKGRRTIYTYFKNKREIYNAVIEQQSNRIIERLRSIVESNELTATERLRNYLHELFDIISQSAPRPEGYRRLLMRDHKRLDRIFRVALDKERSLCDELLRQGIESGEFDAEQAKRLPSVISATITSIYYYHTERTETNVAGEENDNQLYQQKQLHQITNFMVDGITASKPDKPYNT